MAVFEDFGFTALRFLGGDGSNKIEGFRLGDDGVQKVTAVGATRDGAGLLEIAHLEIDDELVELTTADGQTGHAFVEHASIRRLY